jgi:hypothetical protein
MILWCFELTVQLFLKGLPGIFLFVWAWGFLFCLFIFETGSLYVAQADLKLSILLPQALSTL